MQKIVQITSILLFLFNPLNECSNRDSKEDSKYVALNDFDTTIVDSPDSDQWLKFKKDDHLDILDTTYSCCWQAKHSTTHDT